MYSVELPTVDGENEAPVARFANEGDAWEWAQILAERIKGEIISYLPEPKV